MFILVSHGKPRVCCLSGSRTRDTAAWEGERNRWNHWRWRKCGFKILRFRRSWNLGLLMIFESFWIHIYIYTYIIIYIYTVYIYIHIYYTIHIYLKILDDCLRVFHCFSEPGSNGWVWIRCRIRVALISRRLLEVTHLAQPTPLIRSAHCAQLQLRVARCRAFSFGEFLLNNQAAKLGRCRISTSSPLVWGFACRCAEIIPASYWEPLFVCPQEFRSWDPWEILRSMIGYMMIYVFCMRLCKVCLYA